MTITKGQVGSVRSMFEQKASENSSSMPVRPITPASSTAVASNANFSNARKVWGDHFAQAAAIEEQNKAERAKAAAKKAAEAAKQPKTTEAPKQAESSIDRTSTDYQTASSKTKSMFDKQEQVKSANAELQALQARVEAAKSGGAAVSQKEMLELAEKQNAAFEASLSKNERELQDWLAKSKEEMEAPALQAAKVNSETLKTSALKRGAEAKVANIDPKLKVKGNETKYVEAVIKIATDFAAQMHKKSISDSTIAKTIGEFISDSMKIIYNPGSVSQKHATSQKDFVDETVKMGQKIAKIMKDQNSSDKHISEFFIKFIEGSIKFADHSILEVVKYNEGELIDFVEKNQNKGLNLEKVTLALDTADKCHLFDILSMNNGEVECDVSKILGDAPAAEVA